MNGAVNEAISMSVSSFFDSVPTEVRVPKVPVEVPVPAPDEFFSSKQMARLHKKVLELTECRHQVCSQFSILSYIIKHHVMRVTDESHI